MSRIDLLHLEFETISPVSVTAPEAADDTAAETDLPLVTDPAGHPHIPASTLAGSLRAHLHRHGHDGLMGPPPPDDDDDALSPSALSVLGTRVHPEGKTAANDRGIVSRTRTAVDPERGSAREKMLFTQQALAPHARIEVWILSEEPLDDVLDLIATWSPTIGRGKTAGAGRTVMRSCRHGVLDLATADGRRAWLTGLGPDRMRQLCDREIGPGTPDPPAETLTWRARIVDGLHIGTGDHEAGQATPVIRTAAGDPHVPGTTLKGVFRSRALHILESIDPHRQVPASDRVHVDDGDTDDPACPICVLFGNARRAGRLGFRDAPVDGARIVEMPHVALDRFTGGAHDAKLWSDEVVETGTFEIVVTAREPLSPLQRKLLEHVAADLHHGLLGIGGRVGRGHGTVELHPEPAPEPFTDDELAGLRPTPPDDEEAGA